MVISTNLGDLGCTIYLGFRFLFSEEKWMVAKSILWYSADSLGKTYISFTIIILQLE